MKTLISHSEPKARKQHDCMACWFITSGEIGFLTEDETKAFNEAQSNKFKINIGDKYIRQLVKQDGLVYPFVAIPAMHKICIKYDLYEI